VLLYPEHEDKTMKNLCIILLLLLTHNLSAKSIIAAENELIPPITHQAGGDVRVPLDSYIKLIDDARNQKLPAPAAYAIGLSAATVILKEMEDRTTAEIQISSSIEVFEDQWTMVPILPYGAAITSVTIDGSPIQLVQNAEWMSWSTQHAGTSRLVVNYTIDAQRSDQGFVLPIPIPRASSTELTVHFKGNELDLAVIPSSDQQLVSQNQVHTLTADIPTTSAMLISWRMPSSQPYVVSRAQYSGKLQDEAFTFSTNYQVELFTGESIELPIMPDTVILNDVSIDNKPATVIQQAGQFKVLIQGQGLHQLNVTFQIPVIQKQGPPSVSFPIPPVAISEFILNLTGKKDITFFPHSQVSTQVKDGNTIGQTFIPLTNNVTISWADAVPKDIRTKVRANANIYHAISAEEGVLYGHGLIDYEITHGETSSLSFIMPNEVQVNRINAVTAGISDWTVTTEEPKTITVFLDRKVSGNFQLQVEYEQLLYQQTKSDQPAAIDDIKVPLITANNMHRQRGIVALLVGDELTLKPVSEQGVTRVGENQLPAFFRNQIEQVIAHTFKYTSATPKLTVATMAPIRKQGKYDAQVDTLISLGEVTMRGSAGIQIDVKSGSVVDLNLVVPSGVNVLNVSGPSLRNHQVTSQEDMQNIEVEFTQEMTGHFQLEVNYEYILNDGQSELAVPTIHVASAEVQHGRIAVEALTAIEIQAQKTLQLSTLEINELPQQLVLKTTNPILLAFKYVNADTPHELGLRMTRHQELAVQVAAIETAKYQTLITDDGLAVTTAKFDVRNSRLQFLRLTLPSEAEVWSVFVNGQAEKPAHAKNQRKDSQDILVKMLNSASGFPVEIVYATPIKKMGLFGSIQAHLPHPDMVVTHSYWDVFLPIGPNYQAVETNMNVISTNQVANPGRVSHGDNSNDSSIQLGKPLRLTVPKKGIKYSFEKLYANQSDTAAGFAIRYASSAGNQVGLLVSIFSVVMIWAAIFAMKSTQVSNVILLPLLVSGVGGMVYSLSYLKVSSGISLTTALVGGVLFILMVLIPKFKIRT
jgi:hypothetical protein